MSRPGRRRVRQGVAVLAVAGVGVGGYATWSATAASAPAYRTTTAALATVSQTLDLTGTLGEADTSTPEFTTAGTVRRVLVRRGQHVRAGQVVAALGRADLLVSVHRAEAALAAAREQLSSDEEAEDATVTAASTSDTSTSSRTSAAVSPSSTPSSTPTSTPTSTPATPADGTTASAGTPAATSGQSQGGQDSQGSQGSQGATAGTSPALTRALADLHTQQRAVVAAQSTASADLTAAREALAAQTAACATAYQDLSDGSGGTPSPAPSGSPTASPTTSPTASPTTSPTSAPSGSTPADEACTAALAAVQTAQQQVATDQTAVGTAISTLSETLVDAVATLQNAAGGQTGTTGTQGQTDGTPSASPTASTPPTSQPATSAPQSGTSQSGRSSSGAASAPASTTPSSSSTAADTGTSTGPSAGTGGGTQTVTAATLASDQAEIESARADLIDARTSLAGAVLRAPAAGTVAALSVVRGDTVAAGDGVATLRTSGLTTVAVAASADQVAQLKAGQRATITPSGSDRSYAARVSTISTVPDTSGTTTTYPVTLTLVRRGVDLPSGGSAGVAVVVDQATGAVTVPVSAVSGDTVRVLQGASVVSTRVQVGVVGATRVQITSGLAAGATVVLADLDEAVPDTNASTTGTGAGPGGGFGGGTGGPPAGGPGGR